MTDKADFLLRDARPDDRIHLLLWDTPEENELVRIAFDNNAERVNYRKNLLQRIYPGENFLTLHPEGATRASYSEYCKGLTEIANALPVPILFESRRQKIQRFLSVPVLNIQRIWFPIIKNWLTQNFSDNQRIYLVIDRTK